ncbi:MAG: hypothetical protein ACI9O0_000623 [Paracoccaceae bacterium]|jgi:hypothetical protein
MGNYRWMTAANFSRGQRLRAGFAIASRLRVTRGCTSFDLSHPTRANMFGQGQYDRIGLFWFGS